MPRRQSSQFTPFSHLVVRGVCVEMCLARVPVQRSSRGTKGSNFAITGLCQCQCGYFAGKVSGDSLPNYETLSKCLFQSGGVWLGAFVLVCPFSPLFSPSVSLISKWHVRGRSCPFPLPFSEARHPFSFPSFHFIYFKLKLSFEKYKMPEQIVKISVRKDRHHAVPKQSTRSSAKET